MTAPTAPEECDWLDGPGLAAWFRARVRFEQGDNEALAGALRRWKNGAAADVYCVDVYLTQFGLHLSEIPDELYLPVSPRQGNGKGRV